MPVALIHSQPARSRSPLRARQGIGVQPVGERSLETPERGPEEDGAEACAICFDAVPTGAAVTLPCACRAVYCGDCWDRALAASVSTRGRANCPSCRTELRADFDVSSGSLHFSVAREHPRLEWTRRGGEAARTRNICSPVDWSRQLHRQAKPTQIQLLRSFGAAAHESEALGRPPEQDPPAPSLHPRCACGGSLSKLSIRDRVRQFLSEGGARAVSEPLIQRLAQHPPIDCDLCERRVDPGSRVWTCDRGRHTVFHLAAYDVCEPCFDFYALGRGSPGAHAVPQHEASHRTSSQQDHRSHPHRRSRYGR